MGEDQTSATYWYPRWLDMWDTIAKMRSLREIHAWVGLHLELDDVVTSKQEVSILKPLLCVRGPSTFQVYVSWQPNRHSNLWFRNASFEVHHVPSIY